MNFAYYFHDESSVEDFEKKILFLKDKFKIISCQRLIEYFNNPKDKLKNSCCITIDDGWKSTYEIIFPVIKKYNIPITIFVSPQIITKELNFWYYNLNYCNKNAIYEDLINNGIFKCGIKKYPIDLVLKSLDISLISKLINNNLLYKNIPRGFINKDELLEMFSSGLVEIGAHTINHPILSNETDAISFSEISKSIQELSDLLGCNITSFAYPNGIANVDFNNREVEILKKMGIKAAFTVDSNYINKDTNPLLIPRCGNLRRLKLGKIGLCLPSISNQKGIRNKIKKLMTI